MTAEDIETLAEGSASVTAEIIPVDPGPFTAAFLARKLPGRNTGTALAVIGSTSEKTARQIAWTEGKLRCSLFTLLPGERTDDALPRLRAFLADLHDHGDFLLIRPSPEIVRGSEAATAAVLADLGRKLSGSWEGKYAVYFSPAAIPPPCSLKVPERPPLPPERKSSP